MHADHDVLTQLRLGLQSSMPRSVCQRSVFLKRLESVLRWFQSPSPTKASWSKTRKESAWREVLVPAGLGLCGASEIEAKRPLQVLPEAAFWLCLASHYAAKLSLL